MLVHTIAEALTNPQEVRAVLGRVTSLAFVINGQVVTDGPVEIVEKDGRVTFIAGEAPKAKKPKLKVVDG